MAEVTREQLIAALQDQEPVFAVIEMLDKTGSYATGTLRDPDDTADRLLNHMAGQRMIANRFGPAEAADPELAAMGVILAAMEAVDPATRRRLRWWVGERFAEPMGEPPW